MLDNQRFFTVNQFVEYIGINVISKAQIYSEIKAGRIPVTYIGTKVLIPAKYVIDFCESAKCLEVSK